MKNLWRKIKYYAEVSGLFASMGGLILILVLVALPFLLLFAVVVVSLWKLLTILI